MRQDPNPYMPASEYDRIRGPREKRANQDKSREKTPQQAKITANVRPEDTDICPERDENDGVCKPSKRTRPEDPFICDTGRSYQGCTIYIRERKRK